MSLRKAIFRLAAIGFTSTGLLSLSGVAANAAIFDFSYTFRKGPVITAEFEGEVEEDGNLVTITGLESATLTDKTGNLPDFDPAGLAFKSKLALNGEFASAALGTPFREDPHAVGLKVFNNATVNHREFSFVQLVYQSSQGKVSLAEAFSSSAFEFKKRDIPENSSAAVMLTALAGAGLLAAKKHSNRQEA